MTSSPQPAFEAARSESDETPKIRTRADLAIAFEQNRDRLIRVISQRVDRRLSGRIDPSDILQETFLRANAAFDEYCLNSDLPVYNWLRIQAQFAVGDCHRTHLGTAKRAASMERNTTTDSGTAALEDLAESMVTPASQIANADLARKVRELIAGMDERDREVLILRHVEEMSISETAAELRISLEAAKKRHLRALRRLQEICFSLNGSSAG
jgi:RNA polymerase sigma-70 factor (ECF subfamily)